MFMRFFTILSVVLFSFLHVFSQEKQDSTIHKNAIKLDLIPFYHVFFNNRVQIRAGIEFEHFVFKKSSLAFYLDMGLYDKYTFIKYYNFFNQQGMYSIQQKVSIRGAHLLSSYNYYFFSFKKKPNTQFFFGSVVDFGFYKKNIDYYDSSVLEHYQTKYNQAKLGIALSIGLKKGFSKHITTEIKTSLFTKVVNMISQNGVNQIKSLDAEWTSPNYNFWWITNLKIGYAF